MHATTTWKRRHSAKRSVSRSTMSLVVSMAVVAFGCGKSDPFERQPVRGTISWQGKPIQYGSIAFEPAAGQKTGASAAIANGEFTIPRQSGPSPGAYAVWVHAFDRGAEPPPGTAPGDEGPPPKEILPEQYRRTAAAEFEIQAVKDDAPNVLELDLK